MSGTNGPAGWLERAHPGDLHAVTEPAEEFRIDLHPAPDAAAIARRFVQTHSDSLPADLVQDAELLVSELVTNAVRHGEPAISLAVSLDPPLIGVAVHDDGEQVPSDQPVDPGTSAAGGRGLLIVDRLSSSWGVVPSKPPPGKTIWFHLTGNSAV